MMNDDGPVDERNQAAALLTASAVPAEPLTEAELDRLVTIELVETDTTFLLNLPGMWPAHPTGCQLLFALQRGV